MIRSILSSRSVPKNIWPDAIRWATYVMNKSPTLAVKNRTFEECWSGTNPSVHHFRVFEEGKRWNWGKKDKVSIIDSKAQVELESDVE